MASSCAGRAAGQAVSRCARAPAAATSGRMGDEDGSERIAKRLARAGVASRRVAETMIAAGRVAVNGRIVDSPALNVTAADRVTLDGQPVAEPEPTRLWRYHKPAGPRDLGARRARPGHGLRAPARGPAARRLDRPARPQFRGAAAAHQRRRAQAAAGAARRPAGSASTGSGRTALPTRRCWSRSGAASPSRASASCRCGSRSTASRESNAWLTIAIREGRNREVRRALQGGRAGGEPADPRRLRPVPARRPAPGRESRKSGRRSCASNSGSTAEDAARPDRARPGDSAGRPDRSPAVRPDRGQSSCQRMATTSSRVRPARLLRGQAGAEDQLLEGRLADAGRCRAGRRASGPRRRSRRRRRRRRGRGRESCRSWGFSVTV